MSKGYQLMNLLHELPPVSHAVAYGSGVFKSFGSAAVSKSTKVVDYIIAVSNAEEWHAENLQANPAHYGWTSRFIGGKRTARIAERVGLGIHFNPFVNVGGQLCKYGVVSTETLLKDLDEWDHLYLAGRLQKPVKPLVTSDEVDTAVKRNIRAALCAALLLMPENFTKRELYHRICSLSYDGDIRLVFAAEDRSKVDNIVSGSEKELDVLYLGELAGQCGAKAGLSGPGEDGAWSQSEHSPSSSRSDLLACIPQSILNEVSSKLGLGDLNFDCPNSRGSSAAALAREGRYPEALKDVIAARVRQASIRQAKYGVLSTDLSKSVSYLGQKLHKAFLTRK
ncbi:mitochondrial matrix protein Mmp37 [Chloropicon primus]|uniref:Phosphatidate cytidylyltransferase, mitochondrial n=1 Tax=Chloropicon primus TaxID=1764295 RepID=A0A5B8MG09_9CHLO|nr:mitochondrial matrix protein Mmp37 [Chloropicon primus]UPQ98342.1 mitochondrial matrix protein Mmp37 [Chloropicon primus]|eukprot:QDZ19134.1 mitochondrial matrix protein Mmp37 [Chloropicon primus]